jgi:hypothetical protein
MPQTVETGYLRKYLQYVAEFDEPDDLLITNNPHKYEYACTSHDY